MSTDVTLTLMQLMVVNAILGGLLKYNQLLAYCFE